MAELKSYRADLHLHTVLSPCGDIYMSPSAIVEQAQKLHLDIIAICDHNTTRQVKVAQQIGRKKGIMVIGGVEITTQEEAHALAYFENDAQLDAFQDFIDDHLPHIPLDEEKFGYQLIVNENEEVTGEEEWLLWSALDAGLDTLYEKVHEIGGLFVPAHVNKPASSLISQLGFIPPRPESRRFRNIEAREKRRISEKIRLSETLQFHQKLRCAFFTSDR